MKPFTKTLFFVLLIICISQYANQKAMTWGFYSHKIINRIAVFTLPPQMIGFYKKHIEYVTEHAVDPDKRSFADPKEAVKHYIDIDHYGDKPFENMPKYWNDAIAKYTEDTLQTYGINPWNIYKMEFRLTEAFKKQDVDEILWCSANIGHYIADACTPLHTTQYYDGKTPEQKGIHSFWESRIPELTAADFELFTGRAEYIDKPIDKIWKTIKESNEAIDTIFSVEEKMRTDFPQDKKFSYETKGQTQVKTYSKAYTIEFSQKLNGMVEKRMETAILFVGSMWYTAWVNAGQPDLSKIEDKDVSDAHKKQLQEQEKLWKTGKPIDKQNPDK